MTPFTADAVLEMLRRHHLPEGRPAAGLFAHEIAAPNGARRADALWMPLTSAGGGLQGFEIKVSRADVVAELADPMKSDAWARYCAQWWLVVAEPSLVAGLDVPLQWGILAPPSGRRTRSMTVIRPAPIQRPYDGGPAYHRLLAWYCQRAEVAIRSAESSRVRLTQENERLVAKLRDRPTIGQNTSPHYQRVSAIIQRVEQSADAEWIWGQQDDDAIVQAIVDAGRLAAATESTTRHLERTLAELAQAVAPIRDVADRVQLVRDHAPPATRLDRARLGARR